MKNLIFTLFVAFLSVAAFSQDTNVEFVVTDTEQDVFYDREGNVIESPNVGDSLYGQDAQYVRVEPSYIDHGDGTVTDSNTGLMWQKSYKNSQTQYDDAITYCENLSTGGYSDWRLPSIKELFSIADFRGELVLPPGTSTPYINVEYFDFEYPQMFFAAQYWSINKYVKGPIQENELEGAFGFNFADGHIKAYETGYYWNGNPGAPSPGNYVRCVRGEEDIYGSNDFQDNNDGTVSDLSTQLMWQQSDDGVPRDWTESLTYCESLELAGYSDWRLPDVKELQSIVDYEKTTWPAIDDVFSLTDWDSWYWTSTTHGDNKNYACYISFGKAYSKADESASTYYDWHGAGAMRSDPKFGNPDDYYGSSPNAVDLIRIDNYARCVRNITPPSNLLENSNSQNINIYPNPTKDNLVVSIGENNQNKVYKLQLIDINGQTIFENEINKVEINLNAKDFGNNGIYFIKIFNDQGTLVKTKKIILQ